MDKHTPLTGPWELIETAHETMVSDWHIQIGEDHVHVFPYKRVWSKDLSQSGLVTDHEKMAAFRIAAAAPELLAVSVETASAIEDAYEEIYQALPDGPVPDWFVRLEAAVKQARAALAKARGDAVRDPDDFVECQSCYGKGFNDVERQVAERKSDVQTFRETCEACDGTGKVNAGGAA